ncbi:MAG: 2-oxo acid dehydrogenase subunit E2, partial [Bacteroidota bacterium]|nr:2-oxo acid dehydrogenase subunit E2 [Bacteroidota bacterium]
MIDIKVPTIGESISEVTLVKWLKNDGDYVERDEVIAEMESEKATFEVNAEKAGVLKTVVKEGDTLKIGDTVAQIDEKAAKTEAGSQKSGKKAGDKAQEKVEAKKSEEKKTEKENIPKEQILQNTPSAGGNGGMKATPVASAIIADKKIDPKSIHASGQSGKILKDDVWDAINNPGRKPGSKQFTRDENREKMSNLRKTVSRRLVEAKNTTAMLTTFNEVDMSNIMAIRTKYKDKFKEIHNVGLGFMSFFVRACCFALQEWPAVNAYIDGEEIIYHRYCDISIAVSAPKGLVVPVIRNAESLSMAEIEKKVVELA